MMSRSINQFNIVTIVAMMILLHPVYGELYATTATNVTFIFPSLEAKFGPRLPMNGLRGIINVADPVFACSKIAPPPYNSSKVNWFAVIKRGDCDFSTKVYAAQVAGYAAAIVFNDGRSNEIIRMEGGPDDAIVGIPSVFVGEETGFALAESFYYTTGATVVLGRTFPSFWTFYCLPFAMIGVICIMMLIGLAISGIHMLIQSYRQRKRQFRRVNSLPIKKFKKGRDDELYDVCAVCLEDYEDNDKLRVLPCNHAFHARCIDPWILDRDKSTCPLCKQPIERRSEDATSTSCSSHTGAQLQGQPNHDDDESTLPYHQDLEAGLAATGTSESIPLMLPSHSPGSPIAVHSASDFNSQP